MKINQYCSVCKKHLDMDVIPTDDGGDDGVIWLRCPECQGFLPKFTGENLKPEPAEAAPEPAANERPADDAVAEPAAPVDDAAPEHAEPADRETDPIERDVQPDARAGREAKDDAEPAAPAEPVERYAAMLAEADPATARPYRPTSEYAEGDLVHHLAYGDLGIVVAKEDLPGGRKAIKVFFEDAGVVHLIEQAADGR